MLATVGSSAVIESGAGVKVSASQIQLYTTDTRGVLARWGAEGKAVTLALNIGVLTETVHATVCDGAKIDAYGPIGVTANLLYPFAWYLTNPPATSTLQGEDEVKKYVEKLLNGTLGFSRVRRQQLRTQAAASTLASVAPLAQGA